MEFCENYNYLSKFLLSEQINNSEFKFDLVVFNELFMKSTEINKIKNLSFLFENKKIDLTKMCNIINEIYDIINKDKDKKIDFKLLEEMINNNYKHIKDIQNTIYNYYGCYYDGVKANETEIETEMQTNTVTNIISIKDIEKINTAVHLLQECIDNIQEFGNSNFYLLTNLKVDYYHHLIEGLYEKYILFGYFEFLIKLIVSKNKLNYNSAFLLYHALNNSKFIKLEDNNINLYNIQKLKNLLEKIKIYQKLLIEGI